MKGKMAQKRKKKRVQRERGGRNAGNSLPGVSFAVIFSRYNVFKQLATGDPVGKSKKRITNKTNYVSLIACACAFKHRCHALEVQLFFIHGTNIFICWYERMREKDRWGNPLEESSWGFRGESPCCRISLQPGSPALFPWKLALQNRRQPGKAEDGGEEKGGEGFAGG